VVSRSAHNPARSEPQLPEIIDTIRKTKRWVVVPHRNRDEQKRRPQDAVLVSRSSSRAIIMAIHVTAAKEKVKNTALRRRVGPKNLLFQRRAAQDCRVAS
jgi:hypothetical protein